MFTQINNLINWLDAVVWGLPLIILILFTGCLLTIIHGSVDAALARLRTDKPLSNEAK